MPLPKDSCPKGCLVVPRLIFVLGFFLLARVTPLALALSALTPPARDDVVPSSSTCSSNRRTFVLSTLAAVHAQSLPLAHARAPGSQDIPEAVRQIGDAAVDLKALQRDFDKYAVVDAEGRAVTDATVGARRILGGVAPLSGTAAIQVAQMTPLYRIDGAFNVIRKAALEGGGDWGDGLDLLAFEEVAERILFQLQKADGDFYSVQFASKGTTQITGIYKEAKEQVDQGVVDFDRILLLLKEADAPGL